MTDLVVRPYRPSDRAAVGEVCVRTAAAGGDARGVYSDDSLMPDVYALPYVDHAPEVAFVVVDPSTTPPVDGGDAVLAVDDGLAVGYVLAAPDTVEFVRWWQQEWTPGFVERHPRPGPTPAAPSYSEADLLRDGADPTRMLRGISTAELTAYPAHLHIDLIPRAQGRGLGRRLVAVLCAALADRGVAGVHLGHDPANTGARAFYDRLGFVELPFHRPDAPLLGLPTSG
ncbi:GNAT family N-acetyltransferase [Isoptericola jiangsuensis]|uniref:GNAT family N-acetyltransferase n=1 Tax=Isoptericola jiangsuensis TaxID=548579 RepID=UPI003AAE45CF